MSQQLVDSFKGDFDDFIGELLVLLAVTLYQTSKFRSSLSLNAGSWTQQWKKALCLHTEMALGQFEPFLSKVE